jgi:CheY-like chemotaxis protein
MKILLVDDDNFLLDMYALKFTSSGHDVVVAHSGVEALQVLAHATSFFDVVVLDMIMPGMTGTELISAMRTQFPDSAHKYVVLSNQGQEQDIVEAKEAGADGYIIKAATVPSEVVSQVEKIVTS